MTSSEIDLRDTTLEAATVRTALDLQPHPEGGSYRELWRDTPAHGGRGAVSSIHFLLGEGERSHWHRVDAAEIWLWQADAPLRLQIDRNDVTLGPGPGEALQSIVPAHAWQAAQSLGAWTLVSCIVAPAFDFAGFELAPPDWSPP
ncbi:hypothetical protein FHS31_001472 [Sphingomonas vulcanisoli]|uniref:DUF985 domain-containing protein n=1 Tax=Sphingomonas vulcanisoli TaxID=1658060 RepID=A0ABX0TQS4_9SPHN|nr:hypothetical protein [Sphingomonas vulcanisoli]